MKKTLDNEKMSDKIELRMKKFLKFENLKNKKKKGKERKNEKATNDRQRLEFDG